MATPSKTRWCPSCGFKTMIKNRTGKFIPGSIEKMQFLANNHGGICLSDKYMGSGFNLKWRCKEGHEWFAQPSSISQGSWCRKCYFLRQKIIWANKAKSKL
jgi:hypothetical protein